jgi:hydrogenase maturation protein HypF
VTHTQADNRNRREADVAGEGMVRVRLVVRGVVQGVGFRPFVYRVAQELGLRGFVLNGAEGVVIEVEGAGRPAELFADHLRAECPPLARITDIESAAIAVQGSRLFEIRHSDSACEALTLISPDMSICEDCRRELLDPDDRRHGYPFINCTNCGPRYSIIRGIPYDRQQTTMACFAMCAECAAEYADPANRRFHAQPNACWECGPQVTLRDASGREIPAEDPVAEAGQFLRSGAICAIKGLGGYHLAVDATDEAAIRRLRARKHREGKPLAVMAAGLKTALRVAVITGEEQSLLESLEHPIVLVEKREEGRLAEGISIRNNRVGIMLPYTPLHLVLMQHAPDLLVMTSANLTDEPIAIGNREAVRRLGGIADVFLTHNRDICTRSDDSLVASFLGRPALLRRSRGYAPLPVGVPSIPGSVLALGGELKDTVCLVKGGNAFLSQHIGDLKNDVALTFFEETITNLCALYQTTPDVIAHDLHPRYLSSRYARELVRKQPDVRLVGVQHHHAHLAACLADNREEGKAIGVIMDGTGHGLDGTTWGGEFLVGDCLAVERAAHFVPLALPGGDRSVVKPARLALSALHHACGDGALQAARECGLVGEEMAMSESEARTILALIQRGVRVPLSSGLGRLFDAVSALLGICWEQTYEGQGPMELEAAAQTAVATSPARAERQPVALIDVAETVDGLTLDPAPLIRHLATERAAGQGVESLALFFHHALIAAIREVCCRLRDERGVALAALSGGCFQNRLLLTGVATGLAEAGFRVLTHEQTPPNDGCVALGQAAIAVARLAAESIED